MRGGALHLDGVEITAGRFRLHPLTLTVRAGEYLVIVGPTGAGKTLILETIAGLRPLQGGRITLDGEEIDRRPPEHREIGFVYQDYLLFPHLTVRENIIFGLRLRKMDDAVIRKRLSELATILSIEPLLQRRPVTLSGGEAQRVALARALAIEPRVLLLDEPLSSLDPMTRQHLRRALRHLHRRLQVTILHVTHDFDEAFTLGERVAVIHEGRLLQIGTPDEVFRHPNSEAVARFVGVHNLFHGQLRSADDGYRLLEVEGLSIAVVSERMGEVTASIRPEDIILSREPLHSSARNSFRARVTFLEERGLLVYVGLRVPPSFTAVITRHAQEEMALRVGDEVHLAFKASAVHLF